MRSARYTTEEGGQWHTVPWTQCRWTKAYLEEHRDPDWAICHIPGIGEVHSVAFPGGRVWDAFFNGWRPTKVKLARRQWGSVSREWSPAVIPPSFRNRPASTSNLWAQAWGP